MGSPPPTRFYLVGQLTKMDGEQLEKPGGTSPQVELSQGCVVIALAFARLYNYQ